MAQITGETVNTASRESYLQEVYQKAVTGDESALQELSSIALGRTDLPQAKEMIRSLENKQTNEG